MGERFRFSEDAVIFCTATHTYRLHFTEGYLGATATSRIARPGEDWLRGNDLPDGPFGRDTLNKILAAILGYELVVLDPQVEPVMVEANG